MTIPEQVKTRLADLPDKPGCYIMRDKLGRIIYVGKALSLRKRVQSYFRQATMRKADPKLRGLVNSVADLEFIVTRTEAEATLTEGRLIKEYKPRYNVRFKDDKRFLLLAVDRTDPFPRFDLTRIRKTDSREYFGPYASSAAAREALRFVEKQFGVRHCKPRIPTAADHEHCINDIVRYCTAPCVGRIDGIDYAKRVGEACAFLNGERPECLAGIRQEMEQASAAHDFERAAALRDALFRLSEIVRNRTRVLGTPEMKQEDAMEGIRELGRVLALKNPPGLIEAYDISNISGTHAVGGMVCAVDGMPRKNMYRRFRIRTVVGSDDPAMMAEMVSRSFAGTRESGRVMPDLVLIDGGITQVRAVTGALKDLGFAGVPVAGLAKRYEEIYWPGRGRPIRLAAGTPGLKVLQRLRDEAHRFALDYHHRLRARVISESALDDIAGLGEQRKESLLRHFGSLRRLMKASEEDIAQLPGFGTETAKTIVEGLKLLRSKRESGSDRGTEARTDGHG